MPLAGQVIDVPIAPLWQQSPPSAPLIGRLQTLVNAKVVKFTSGSAAASAPGSQGGQERMRVEKRDGFTRLTTSVIAHSTGGSSSGVWAAPQLLDTLNNQLVGIIADRPWVYAPNKPVWTRYSNHVQTNQCSQRIVYTANSQAVIPDAAYLNGITMYTWGNTVSIGGTGLGVQAAWVDDTGTVLQGPFTIDNTAFSARVVSDGTQFWCLTSVGGTITIRVFTATGVQQAVTTVSGGRNDITFSPTLGVVAAVLTGASEPTIYFLSVSGATITATGTTDASIHGNTQVNFLTNQADGKLFIATLDNQASVYSLYAYRIPTNSGQKDHQYAFGTVTASVSQVAGQCSDDGLGTVTLSWTTTSATNTRSSNTQTASLDTSATMLGPYIKYSTLIASRAFKVPGDSTYSMLVYVGSVNANQQSFFLMDSSTANTQQAITGQFDLGLASAEWVGTTGNVQYWWQPASTFMDNAGSLHIPAGYRAESFTSGVAQQIEAILQGALLAIGTGVVFSPFVSTIGIKDFIIGATFGQAVEFANEMLIPGTQGGFFDGLQFSEDGVCLGFEGPTLTATTGGSLTPSSVYQVVVVPEWTDNGGNRVKGLPSPPVNVSLSPSQNAISISGFNINTTNKTNLMISVYSSWITGGVQSGITINGVQSTLHAKVTNDLNPTYNDPTAATWSYTITQSDATISAGERLYTDTGLLPRQPCPAFSQGCQWQSRVWVSAYDGSIWFSGQKTEGDSLWFSGFQRVKMPTQEQWVLAPMDSFMLIMGRTSKKIYVIEAGSLPDPTGATGAIPTPSLLPFANGSTGFVAVGRDGAFYSSTTGGVWLITRDLQNHFASAGAMDYFPAGVSVIGMEIDQNQRLAVLLSNNTMVVWDTISQTWAEYTTTATTPTILTVWNGAFTFGASDGAWPQVTGSFADIGGSSTPIVTSFQIAPINLHSVQNFKRIWAAQILGTYLGAHTLSVVANYVSDSLTRSATYLFTPSSSVPYRFELPPAVELSSSVSYTFTDGFPGSVASQGFSLEMLSLYLGMEKGTAKLPIAQRIQPTGVVS